MKRFLLLFIAAFAFQSFCGAATYEQIEQKYGAETADRSMAFTLSPLQLFLLSLDGKFMFKLSDKFALTVPVVFEYIPSNDVIKTRDVLFISGGLGTRYQISGRVLESGFFTELALSFGYSQLTPQSTASFSSTFLRTTGLIGYSYAFGSGFSINLAGGGYYNYAFSHEAPVLKKAFSALPDGGGEALSALGSTLGLTNGLGMTAELSLGFAW